MNKKYFKTFILPLCLFLISFSFSSTLSAQQVPPTEPVSGSNASAGLLLSSGGNVTGGGITVQADEFTGAATYQYEIPVPPGVNGLTPKLVLNYNSHRKNPNSWVGYGWSLDLGYIQRTPEQGSIVYSRGTNFEVNIGGQTEALELGKTNIDLSQYGLNYGPNAFGDEYSAKIDTSFNIYIHIRRGPPNFAKEDLGWIVIDKSGKRFVFGNASDAVVGDAKFDGVKKWFLTRVEDTNKNQINISYDANKLPRVVSYAEIFISFITEDNHPFFPAYREEFLERNNVKTLTDVIIEDNANSQRLARIALSYQSDDLNSTPLLKAIRRYGKNDNSQLPPVEFGYNTQGLTFRFHENPFNYQASREEQGEYTSGLVNDWTVLIDMNADGLPDQVVGFKDSSLFKVYYNNGNDFVEVQGKSDWQDPFACDPGKKCRGKINAFYQDDDNRQNQWLYLIDMNGDSLPDRVSRYQDPDTDVKYFAVAYNDGESWSTGAFWKDPYQGKWAGYTNDRVGFVDMNGDGLIDRVVGDKKAGGFQVYKNTGVGFKLTAEFWSDPLAVFSPGNDGIAKLVQFDPFKKRSSSFVRDLNGDGLPDRFFQAIANKYDVNGNKIESKTGFSVSMNPNGNGWVQPVENPQRKGHFLYDSINTIFMADPVDEDSQGFLNDTHDLIDFNQDGFLDRVSGDPETGKFKVYLYNGLVGAEFYEHFKKGLPIEMTDPIQDGKGNWDGMGYITRFEDKDKHTFFMDIDGDGYPDRVSLDPRNDKKVARQYQVFPFRSHVRKISDSPAFWQNKEINQPLQALNVVVVNGLVQAWIVYQPSTWKLDFNEPNHRFLPFNLPVVRKIMFADPTMSLADYNLQTPDSKYPGVNRSVTYSYRNGNLYIRRAFKKKPLDPEDDALDRPYFAEFNGFYQVEKNYYPPLNGKTVSVVDRFYQAKGDAPDFLDLPKNPAVYRHYTLSGKLFETTTTESGGYAVKEYFFWDVNKKHLSFYECLGPCQPKLKQKYSEIWPLQNQKTGLTTDYEYDGANNVAKETLHAGEKTLLEKVTTYYDPKDFDPALMIRNKPRLVTEELKGSIYRKKEFFYDAKGNAKKEMAYADLAGNKANTIERSFYPDGNPQEVADVNGVTTHYDYDPIGIFPVTKEVQLGNGQQLTTTTEYDRLTGAVKKEIGPNNNGSRTVVDDFGRPLEEYGVDTQGGENLLRKYAYSYQISNLHDYQNPVTLLKTTVIEPRPDYPDTAIKPSKITYALLNGQVLQECTLSEKGDYRQIQKKLWNMGKDLEQTEPVFDADCNWLAAFDKNARTFTAKKDLLGRPTLIQPPPGDAQSPVGTVSFDYAYDQDDLEIKTTTFAKGTKKKETYDRQGRLVSVVDADNTEMTYVYNPVGDLMDVIQGGKNLTHIDSDLLGRKTLMTDADMGTWTYDYDNFGRLETQTDNKGQKIKFYYTTLSRLLKKESFDSKGGLEKTDSYSYDTGAMGYDVKPGELFQVEEFDGAKKLLLKTRYSYDPLYRREDKAVRFIPNVGEFTIKKETNYRGELRSIIYPAGENVFYTYSRTGNLEKVCSKQTCDPQKNEVYYSVDPVTGYNEFMALQNEQFGNGVVSEYSHYPNSHRMQSGTVRTGQKIVSQKNYTYDKHANIATIDDPLNLTGSAGYSAVSYDNLDRLTGYTSKNEPAPAVLSYDVAGNMKTNSPSQGNVPYEYTSPRPHAVTKIGADVFGYDDNGNMISDPHRTMDYNAQNHLKRVTMKNGSFVDYAYDYTGSRIAKKSTKKDPLGVVHESAAYYLGDAVEIKNDNLILHLYANGKKIATKSLGSLKNMGGGGTLRQIGIDLPLNFAQLVPYFFILFALFTIASLRPVRPWPAWMCRGPPKTFFRPLYNAWARYVLAVRESVFLFHLNPFPKFVSLFLVFLFISQTPLMALAGDVGVPLKATSDEKYLYYIHGDHLGSTNLLTEGNEQGRHAGIVFKKGELIQRFEYAPFGREQYALNPNLKFDPSYTGQSYDIETGLYYYKARYYNPLLGRFIQPDTIVPGAKNLQSFNRYTYANNNPLKYIDPTGHDFWNSFLKFLSYIVTLGLAALIYVLSRGNEVAKFNLSRSAEKTAAKYHFDYGGEEPNILDGIVDPGVDDKTGWLGDTNNRSDGYLGFMLMIDFNEQISQMPSNPGLAVAGYSGSSSVSTATLGYFYVQTQPNTAEDIQAMKDVAHQTVLMAGIAVAVTVGYGAGPVAAGLWLSNPVAANSFATGFVSGFASTSGIGKTELPSADQYEAAGYFVGEQIGKFFDF